MKEERKKVLDMLEQGKVSPEEAAKLLDCLEENEEKQSMRVQTDAARMKGKKLRVEVNGFVEGSKKINVNEELKGKGIDLCALNIGQIVDMFESLEEDIVNVDMDQDGNDLKVRVYVD